MIEKLLIVLQTYKSSGNFEKGSEFYAKYSQVSPFFLKIRDLVISKKMPRKLVLNNNLVKTPEGITPEVYPENFEGIISSFQDRYPFDENLKN